VSADARIKLIAGRQYGHFHLSQARDAGLSESAILRRIRSGTFERVRPGVLRVSGSPPSWEGSLIRECLRALGEAWAWGPSAAALWTLDGFEPNGIFVCSTRDLRNPSVWHLTGIDRCDTTRLKAIPVTTVHRTLIDLGAVGGADLVELALESALRRRMTTTDRLLRRLEALEGRGRRGPAILRSILDQRGPVPPTESALETRFLQFLRRYNVPMPTRQHRVTDLGFVARVDFFYDGHGVVIEVDSRAHHLRRAQWEADLRRRNALTASGLQVLHVTHERMRIDPSGLAEEIAKALG
jgi:very-short-patch-repair endonuclease